MRKILYTAAITVGSHELVMKIAALKPNGKPKIIEEVRRTIPLGVDTYTTGELSPLLLEQMIKALNGFQKKAEEYKITTIRAVATSAFREASNKLYAIDHIQHRTGFEVEILPSSMDLYYHQLALSEDFPNFETLTKTNMLILNIGSGSINLTLYREGKYINTQSFRLGALRIRELLGDLERHSHNFNELMAEYITGDLYYYRTFGPKREKYQNLLVIGSAVRNIRHIGKWMDKEHQIIEKADFEALFENLNKGDKAALQRLEQIPTEQKSLLLPACIVIDKVLQFTEIDHLGLSDASLADGILYEQAAELADYEFKHDPDAYKIEAARFLANRYRTDKRHLQHVEMLAIHLFDATRKIHGLDKKPRLYLQMGAILHSIGKYINMENDEQFTFNMIQSSQLIGLDEEESLIVALIASFHNGHITPNEPWMQSLSANKKLLILKLIAILTIANSLDAGHKQKIEILQTKIDEKELIITVGSTQDITLELWNFNKHISLFVNIFNIRPILRLRKPKMLTATGYK